MVTMKAGSHAHQLLQLLAVSVEFPASSLHLLGNARVLKHLLHRLESAQEVRVPSAALTVHTKVFAVSGQRNSRNIRLSKGALPLLNTLHPDALAYYMNASQNHQFSGGHYHIGRNHRVGEAVAMAMVAGLEYRPYVLPPLQNRCELPATPAEPSFYIARDFKENAYDEMDKTVFTRIVGAVFYPGGCYAVYNTRGAVMKWSGAGEFKALLYLTDLARRNAGFRELDSALLLGTDLTIALQTVLESDKSKRHNMRMDAIYKNVHFVPLNADGIKLLQILTMQDWSERILDALFEEDQRVQGYSSIECDARINGVYILSQLDGNLARLIRFREGLRLEKQTDNQFEVLCYPWQRDFLQAYLGERVKLRIISMEVLQNAIE